MLEFFYRRYVNAKQPESSKYQRAPSADLRARLHMHCLCCRVWCFLEKAFKKIKKFRRAYALLPFTALEQG